MDEHRIGLKPIVRGVWAPVGERPIALGHHRFEWLYVTGFVEPVSGRTVWNIANAVCKEMFELVLADFAKSVGAGPTKRIVLQLDNAGWHGPENLAVPDAARRPAQDRGPVRQGRSHLDHGSRYSERRGPCRNAKGRSARLVSRRHAQGPAFQTGDGAAQTPLAGGSRGGRCQASAAGPGGVRAGTEPRTHQQGTRHAAPQAQMAMVASQADSGDGEPLT